MYWSLKALWILFSFYKLNFLHHHLNAMILTIMNTSTDCANNTQVLHISWSPFESVSIALGLFANWVLWNDKCSCSYLEVCSNDIQLDLINFTPDLEKWRNHTNNLWQYNMMKINKLRNDNTLMMSVYKNISYSLGYVQSHCLKKW